MAVLNAPAPTTPNASSSRPVVDTTRSPQARLRPLRLGAVRLSDTFWAPRLELVRQVTLRQQHEQNEATGRIDNFRRAAGKLQTEFQGRYYNDSDVYKWLEAASYALATADDPELGALVGEVVQAIADAQSPDGYLNTYFTFEREPERFTDLTTKHELYCAGHLIQAAVAHHRATGTRALLDVATRLADHLCTTFGPGKRAGTDGHEEIELALVELYRETGDRRYLDQAAFFLDQRGQQPPVIGGSPYHQDHLPVRQQREIVGHAVRATYLAIGMSDVYGESGDHALWEAVQALWASAFRTKAYVTGGLGAHWQGESFGAPYELPNERAYAETCAAIGGFLWNWRMLLLTGEATYAEWMETALYNGILSGLSLDGTEYFYQNPLADGGTHRRQPWFGTACCPPNIARLLLSLPGFLASTTGDDGLWVHQYVAGTVQATLPAGSDVTLQVDTRYPWDGAVRLTVQSPASGTEAARDFTLHLRVPAWTTGATVAVNGESANTAASGSYAVLRRTWQPGDVIELHVPMHVRQVVSHPYVSENTGRVALARGPLVYCVEAVDHPGTDVRDLALPADASFRTEWRPDLLGGVTVLHTTAQVQTPDRWQGALYEPTDGSTVSAGIHASESPDVRTTTLTAIPYFAWANRDPGAMQVWLRRATSRA